MAYRTLEVKVVSARDLKDVNLVSKMAVYAEVSIPDVPKATHRTQADHKGGLNPSWDHTFAFSLPADPKHHSLRVLLRTQRPLGDRDVGEVRIPLANILYGSKGTHSYQVRVPDSNLARGVLDLSFNLKDPVVVSYQYRDTSYPPPVENTVKYDGAVAAYTGGYSYAKPPAPPAYSTSYGVYPANYMGHPPPGYHHAPPQIAAYGWCPMQPPVYGYATTEEKRGFRSKMKTAGLIGCAVGGLLVGAIASAADGSHDSDHNSDSVKKQGKLRNRNN